MSFIPQQNDIVNITQSISCVVTTLNPHNLTTGQVVRMIVPKAYGMQELDQRLVSVTVLTSDSFSIQETQVPPAVDVNSTNFVAFTMPAKYQRVPAQIVCVGSRPTPIVDPSFYVQNGTCVSDVLDATRNIEK